MCEAMEKFARQERDEGILEGAMKTKIQAVINLLNLGFPLDAIAKGLELSIEEVKRILQSDVAK